MMHNNRSYGLHADRDFGIDLSMMFQFTFGLITIPVNAISTFILLRYSRNLSGTLRIGYLTNQVQMFLHDVWSSFLFRMYPILPYPIFYCEGLFCRSFPSFSMVIEIIFMINASSLLVFMLLMIHQQILPSSHKLHFSVRLRVMFVGSIYSISLFSNGITSFLNRNNVENALEIIQENDLNWLTHRSGALIIYGDVGNMGSFRYMEFAIMASILTLAPLRIILIGTSVRFLENQKLVHSRTVQLKKRIINVLIQQTVVVSTFYVYPLLILILVMFFSIAFLPDDLLFAIRLLIIPLSMLNSLGQLVVQFQTNNQFRNMLRLKAQHVFPIVQRVSGGNRTLTTQ